MNAINSRSKGKMRTYEETPGARHYLSYTEKYMYEKRSGSCQYRHD